MAKFNPAVPAALIPFVVPMASFAAEGTGRVSLFFLRSENELVSWTSFVHTYDLNSSVRSHQPSIHIYCRPSVSMMADSSGPPSFLPSLSSPYILSGPRIRSPTTFSMVTRRDVRVKPGVLYLLLTPGPLCFLLNILVVNT